MNRMMWRACAVASALFGVALSGSQAFAQAKTEIALSRQPGIQLSANGGLGKSSSASMSKRCRSVSDSSSDWRSSNLTAT